MMRLINRVTFQLSLLARIAARSLTNSVVLYGGITEYNVYNVSIRGKIYIQVLCIFSVVCGGSCAA